MRNAVIGVVLFAILVLTMVTLYGIEGKTTRQNELDANLSSAMESSMEVMTIDPKYAIDNEDSDELIADFIQNFLVRMNSDSEFEIEILECDAEKGLLSVRATETYRSVFSNSSVSATRTVVLDDYSNTDDGYFEVTFYEEYDDSTQKYTKPIKQVQVFGGSSLEEFATEDPVRNGYTFTGWELRDDTGYLLEFTNFKDITVTTDIKFNATWSKDADNIKTVTLYADNKVFASKKVTSGSSIGLVADAPSKDGYAFAGWSSKNGERLTNAELEKEVVKTHKTYTAVYEKK